MGPSDLLLRTPLGIDRKPLFKSQAEVARQIARISNHFDEAKWKTCNSMLSHYLKTSDDSSARVMPEEYRSAILDLIEEKLSNDPYDPPELVKRQFLESLAPSDIKNGQEPPPRLAGEDRILQEFCDDLHKSRFSVFCRWDEGLSSMHGNVKRLYHELSHHLFAASGGSEENGGRFHFFFSTEYHRKRFVNSLFQERKTPDSGYTDRPLKELLSQGHQIDVAPFPSFYARLAVLDPQTIEQRGYFLYVNEKDVLLPLKLAQREVEDWCEYVYAPFLESEEGKRALLMGQDASEKSTP